MLSERFAQRNGWQANPRACTPSSRLSDTRSPFLLRLQGLAIDPLQPGDADWHFDVVVIGGGVSGLWTAARLAKSGRRVLLLERGLLGGVQTVASQGILHGGIKYALGGEATAATKAVSLMPDRWRRSMLAEPQGELDLRSIRTLCPAQYLWTTDSFFSRMTAGAAARAIRTRVDRVKSQDACAGLRSATDGTRIYRVDEPVIDARSCVLALRDELLKHGGVVRKHAGDLSVSMATGRLSIDFATVSFSTAVLAAGAGNGALVSGLAGAPAMQTRPLHMVLAKGSLPPVFGHCIGSLSDKPRITITSHSTRSADLVWYIGGMVAESGVHRRREAQIDAARREIGACLPWIDLRGVQWSTLHIDRAEGLTPNGHRPDGPVVQRVQVSGEVAVVAAWPTKLVFAPMVADLVEALIPTAVTAGNTRRDSLQGLPGVEPGVAELPWEDQGVVWS